MSGWIVTGIIAVPFIVLAIFMLNGKGAFLIAGYNTMGRDKKALYNEKAVCKAVGKLLLVLTALMFLFPLAMQLDAMWLFWVAFALFMVVSIGFAIYANTGNRYRIAGVTGVAGVRAPMTQGKKVAIVVSVGITVLVLIGMGLMFFFGERDPIIHIQNNSIQISAMYGLTIDNSDIAEINLINQSMRDIGVGARTNGYGGFGEALKGNFSSASHGQVLLFVYSSSSPTIQIVRSNGVDIFLSFRNNETTMNIYQELSTVIS